MLLKRHLKTAFVISSLLALTSSYAMRSPIAIEDDMHNKVLLTKPARHIAVTIPHLAKQIHEVCSNCIIVAAPSHTNVPHKTNIGDYNKINIPLIIKRKPDVVFIGKSINAKNYRNQLLKAKIPAYMANDDRLSNLGKRIEDIAIMTGQDNKSVIMPEKFNEQKDQIREEFKAKKPVRVAAVFYKRNDGKFYVAKAGTAQGDILNLINAKNVLAKGTQKTYTAAEISKAKPDVVLYFNTTKKPLADNTFGPGIRVENGIGPQLVDAYFKPSASSLSEYKKLGNMIRQK